MSEFDEQYFKSINYVNYLDREERYEKLAKELCSYLKNVGYINEKSMIIDYGAAIGFLTNAIRNIGYNCDAYDISDWAKQYGYKKYGITYIYYEKKQYDLMIALDVFEHMSDNQIIDMLNTFTVNHIVIRIPCSSDGLTFHLNISNQDHTHINCKTKSKWEDFFEKIGFKIDHNINLYTIFDSEGVMCAILTNNKK